MRLFKNNYYFKFIQLYIFPSKDSIFEKKKLMFKRIIYYLNPLTLFQKNKVETESISMKTMHVINRISIYMFIVCLILVLRKYL